MAFHRCAGQAVIPKTYLYGYDLVPTDSNTGTRVVYPSDVDNYGYTPAAMNFETDTFNYGNWPSTPGEKFMPVPVGLDRGAFDGTYFSPANSNVAGYLDPNDYSKEVDGSISHVSTIYDSQDAFMQWPKIYTKRWQENNVYKFRCSDAKIDDTWKAWSNYNANNEEIDHFYTSIYSCCLFGGVARSLSGGTNLLISKTAQEELELIGTTILDSELFLTGYYSDVLADHLLIQDLLVMMARSTNSQVAYGTGRCKSGISTAIDTGTMDTKGMFWGDDDQTSGVKVFGMENRWGNLFRRTAGWINANGTQKIKITQGTYDGSTVENYNLTGDGYLTVAVATPSGTNGGYISSMKNDLPFGRIPVVASGSATTYECDVLYFNNAQSNYAKIGTPYGRATLCGEFAADLSSTTIASPNTTVCLSYKPVVIGIPI